MTPEQRRDRAKSTLSDEIVTEAFEDTKQFYLKKLLAEENEGRRTEAWNAYHAVSIAHRKLLSWPFDAKQDKDKT